VRIAEGTHRQFNPVLLPACPATPLLDYEHHGLHAMNAAAPSKTCGPLPRLQNPHRLLPFDYIADYAVGQSDLPCRRQPMLAVAINAGENRAVTMPDIPSPHHCSHAEPRRPSPCPTKTWQKQVSDDCSSTKTVTPSENMFVKCARVSIDILFFLNGASAK